jgi:hypothetical protein
MDIILKIGFAAGAILLYFIYDFGKFIGYQEK